MQGWKRMRVRKAEPTATLRDRIEADLVQRGVSAPFSAPVAARLAERCSQLETPAYEAALDGVAAAFTVYSEDCEALERSARNIDEIQRLMRGFAGELRKLEEGLRIVSAYVLRMNDKATKDRRSLLH